MLAFGNNKKNLRRPESERGQAFVLVALGVVALIAVIGLATDAAMIYKTKQDLQRAIDSSALAGAYKLPNQATATTAVYEFTRLHGYNFDPITNPLTITFPNSDTRKIVHVEGTTNATYFFLRILGFNTMTVSAAGDGEAAPMDVYLILDLSESMVYDTAKPSPWPPAGFTTCNQWDNNNMYDCIAKYCNWARKCDPLDIYVKPAASFFIDQLDPRYDRVGVVAYTQFGVKVIGLSNDFNGVNGVKAKIAALNAWDHQGDPGSNCPNTSPSGCNKQTNIGDGISIAHANLAAEGRQDAIWSLVLETDGKANVYRSWPNCYPPNTLSGCGAAPGSTLFLCNECQQAIDWATNTAWYTWKQNETVIYTIAYGTGSPGFEDLMKDIADWTDDGQLNGTYDDFFAAPDGPALQNAFLEIAQRIYARLLQ